MSSLSSAARAGRLDALIPLALTFTMFALASGRSQAGNAFVTPYETPEVRESETKIRARVSAAQGFTASDADVNTELTNAKADPEKAKKRWARFAFTSESTGVGDAEVSPLGDAVEYKLNAVNFNLHLGDTVKVPLQIYMGDFASDEAAEDTNKQKLLDPTTGIAFQFPIAWKYVGPIQSAVGAKGKFCQFLDPDTLPGSCVIGGDITLRAVRLNETAESGDVTRSFVAGGSASLKAALQFPILPGNAAKNDPPAGMLGIAFGARYYYHNTDKQDLLFGELVDPEGNPIDAKKGFAAFNAECEFEIKEKFKIRLEYFSPLSNKDVLSDVFKASFVLAAK
jgi:hypothetical protein